MSGTTVLTVFASVFISGVATGVVGTGAFVCGATGAVLGAKKLGKIFSNSQGDVDQNKEKANLTKKAVKFIGYSTVAVAGGIGLLATVSLVSVVCIRRILSGN